MRYYLSKTLPVVVFLEFTSYFCLAANVWLHNSGWGWYAGALALSLAHLFNAPYAWKLLQQLQAERKEVTVDRRVALDSFLSMNLFRILATDIPLIILVVIPFL